MILHEGVRVATEQLKVKMIAQLNIVVFSVQDGQAITCQVARLMR